MLLENQYQTLCMEISKINLQHYIFEYDTYKNMVESSKWCHMRNRQQTAKKLYMLGIRLKVYEIQ